MIWCFFLSTLLQTSFYLLVRPKLEFFLASRTFQTQHLKRQKELGDKEKVQKLKKREKEKVFMGWGVLKMVWTHSEGRAAVP